MLCFETFIVLIYLQRATLKYNAYFKFYSDNSLFCEPKIIFEYSRLQHELNLPKNILLTFNSFHHIYYSNNPRDTL